MSCGNKIVCLLFCFKSLQSRAICRTNLACSNKQMAERKDRIASMGNSLSIKNTDKNTKCY